MYPLACKSPTSLNCLLTSRKRLTLWLSRVCDYCAVFDGITSGNRRARVRTKGRERSIGDMVLFFMMRADQFCTLYSIAQQLICSQVESLAT